MHGRYGVMAKYARSLGYDLGWDREEREDGFDDQAEIYQDSIAVGYGFSFNFHIL